MNYDETRMIPGEIVGIASSVSAGSVEEHWLSPGRRFSISLYATGPGNISMIVRENGRIILPMATTHFEYPGRANVWQSLGMRAYERPLTLPDMRMLRRAYMLMLECEEAGLPLRYDPEKGSE